MELWNVKHLNPPPINSFKAPIKEVDVRLLKTTLKNAVDFFDNQKELCVEAALLSRTVYRFKMKFRSSKDFKSVEKLSQALRVYLQMQITKSMKIVLNSIPHQYKMNETYLPTKHMLDFVLVRMQSLGKLLVRILETCKIVCQFMQQRLRLGHFWKLAIMIYAIASRIFVISRALAKRTCEFYLDLLPFSSKLSNIGRQWLPDGYILPENLSQWLDLDWLDSERTIIEIEDDESASAYFNLVDDSDDDVEFSDEYVLIRDEDDSFLTKNKDTKNKNDRKKTIKFSQNDYLMGFSEDIDVGEVITLTDSEVTENTTNTAATSKSNANKRKRKRKLALRENSKKKKLN